MQRRCLECKKLFSGSVVEHYQKFHFSALIREGEEKIRKHPDVFAPIFCSKQAIALQKEEAKQKAEARIKKAESLIMKNKGFCRRMRMVSDFINSGCDMQKYNEGNIFQCDMCKENKQTGKRLLSETTRYTVCYECYKLVKSANPKKCGNPHMWILTPM